MTAPVKGVPFDFDALIEEMGVSDFVDDARQAALARAIAYLGDAAGAQSTPERLPRYGFMFESRGLAALRVGIASPDAADMLRARTAFLAAFQCWRALASLPGSEGQSNPRRNWAAGSAIAAAEVPNEIISPGLSLALRLAVSGLLAERPAEARLELGRFEIDTSPADQSWRNRVVACVAGATVLLVRKGGAWADVNRALESVQQLKRLQREYEQDYLTERGDAAEQGIAAVELVGLYHLAQLLSTVGDYLRVGETSMTQVLSRIDRHHDRSREAFVGVRLGFLVHLADLVWAAARELVRNSIWSHVSGVGEELKNFGRQLARQGATKPVIELWPSQQQALREGLLDPYKRAILVEMPTSAGKTLLAKFAIVQSRALNPNGTVAYLVPTRALVNQVTLDLRADLRLVGLSVEQAVPATEMDPTEDKLLQSAPDVLVATPEKLDLLLRRNHASVQHTALVIADEAHNLRERGRGARLELLLGMLKRDRPDARFLMLSPFLPNDEELVAWLGDDRALPPIKANWKPSGRLVGALRAEGRQSNRRLIFETLPAADNVDIAAGRKIAIGPNPGSSSGSIKGLTKAAVEALGRRGATLVLCEGPGTSITRAKQLSADRAEMPATPERDAVCRYLDAELGEGSALVRCIRRGVAYHHSGLSAETRWLVESLIRRDQVSVVCGTTTLAQGVNFPISNVIVESLDKGSEKLSYEDFWNIAGRAGRALVDTVGIVAFPSPSLEKREAYVDFLRGEAQEISSQLAGLIDRADEILARGFNMSAVFKWPELSTLMQFLAHAMRTAGSDDLAENVEDLLRASLVYRQAQQRGGDAASKLVKICRAYLAQVKGQSDLLALADQTGFATPSVLQLRAKAFDSPELRDLTEWQPDRLFGQDVGALSQRVQAIADLPEMQLGVASGGPFNADRIASILRDWVNGETLSTLAERYPVGPEVDADKRLESFSKYLFKDLLGRASWGMGALESVCFVGKDQAEIDDAGYVPSMIFFGVKQREAVWLRMVGVPRVVADGLAGVWRDQKSADPSSFEGIRKWVGALSDAEWRKATPAHIPLTPSDLRVLWREFVA